MYGESTNFVKFRNKIYYINAFFIVSVIPIKSKYAMLEITKYVIV